MTVDPPERPAGWEPLLVGEQTGDSAGPDVRHVRFDVSGTSPLVDPVAGIESLDGVLQVRAEDANVITE